MRRFPPYCQNRGIWNRREQAGIGGTVALGLTVLLVGAFAAGMHCGRGVDIDRVAPLSQQFQVDVNTAAWPEWTLLPGIGETLAKRIVASRQAAGPFRRPEDLLRVHGIGPRKLDGLRPYLLPRKGGPQAVPTD